MLLPRDAGRRRGRRPPAGDRGSRERPRAPGRARLSVVWMASTSAPSSPRIDARSCDGGPAATEVVPSRSTSSSGRPSATVPWTTERAPRRRQAELGERRRVRRAGRRDGNVARARRDRPPRRPCSRRAVPRAPRRRSPPGRAPRAPRRCRARGRARRLRRAAPARRPPPSPPSRSPPSSRARR